PTPTLPSFPTRRSSDLPNCTPLFDRRFLSSLGEVIRQPDRHACEWNGRDAESEPHPVRPRDDPPSVRFVFVNTLAAWSSRLLRGDRKSTRLNSSHVSIS